MKSKNGSQYLIGTAVILCSLTLLGAMTFALSGYTMRKGGRKLDIDFRDATGIKPHSVVKYAGKTAGYVSAIRYLSPAERLKGKDRGNAVRVTLQFDKETPPFTVDVAARLDAETLLGEKFVALTPGKPDAPLLPEDAVIQGGEAGSIDALMRSSAAAMENVNDLLTKLKSDYPALVPRLGELLNQGSSLLSQSSNLVNNADSTILNANEAVTKLRSDYNALVPRINSVFDQAQGIATNADAALLKVSALVDRADGVVKTNEADLAKIVAELRVVSQNLKVITTYAKGLTAALAEKPSRIIWGRTKNGLPSEKQILESSQPLPMEKPKQ
jgi:ABC-type transporter Mla subunit MlaD